MTADKVRRFLSLFQRGIILASELGWQLIDEMAYEKELDTTWLSEIVLPKEIEEAFHLALRKIKGDGFKHTVTVVGGKAPPTDPERLRQIWIAVGLE